MGVQRFTASNSREAMRQVRAALGDQVLILSNRSVEGGVEKGYTKAALWFQLHSTMLHAGL